jgi:hypothetical protein
MPHMTLKEHLILWYEMFVHGEFGSAREFAEHQGMELSECEQMLETGRKYYNLKKESEDEN